MFYERIIAECLYIFSVDGSISALFTMPRCQQKKTGTTIIELFPH